MQNQSQQMTVQSGSTIFPGMRHTGQFPPGMSVAEILERMGLGGELFDYCVVSLNGIPLEPSFWPRTRPKAGTFLAVGIHPGRGDGLLSIEGKRTLFSILSLVAGTGVASAVGASGTAAYMIRTAVFFLGMMALNTFLPIPPKEDFSTFGLTGVSNRLSAGGVVPAVYGKVKLFPPLCAVPITETNDREQSIRLLFVLGYKPMRIHRDTIMIGNMPIRDFLSSGDIKIEIVDGYDSNTKRITLYTDDVDQVNINQTLNHAAGWYFYNATRQPMITLRRDPWALTEPIGYTLDSNIFRFDTSPDTVGISIDFEFPDGLGRRKGSEVLGYSVILQIRYRPKYSEGDTWIYHIPDFDRSYLNTAIAGLTETKLYAALVKLNEFLADVVQALKAVTSILRLTSFAMKRAVTRAYRGFLDKLDVTLSLETMTPEMQLELTGTQQQVLEAAADIDAAAETTDAAAQGLGTFNAILSLLLEIIRLLDDFLDVRDYLARGYGPELSTLTSFQRWIIGNANLEHLFGDVPSGAFLVSTDDRQLRRFYRSTTIPVHADEYEVQIRRITEQFPDNEDIIDTVNVSTVRSIRAIDGISGLPPINPDIVDDLVLMAMHITATEKLNSSLQQVSMIVEKPLQVYDGGWTERAHLTYDFGSGEEEVCRNPIWQFADIRRGRATQNKASDTAFDSDKLLELATYCANEDEPWFFSGVFDRQMTIKQACDDVLRCAKGYGVLSDGLIAAVLDRAELEPVAILTNSNSRNFEIQIAVQEPPDVILLPYLNPDKDWAIDQLSVYNDGYGKQGERRKSRGYFTADDADTITLPFVAEDVELLYDMDGATDVPWIEYRIIPWIRRDGSRYSKLVRTGGAEWSLLANNYRADIWYTTVKPRTSEEFNIPGLVDSHDQGSEYFTGQAYRLGRYMQKVMALRPEVFTIEVFWEHLVFQVGDVVRINNDVPMWGVASARLLAFETDGSDYVFTLDNGFTMEDGKVYQMLIREDLASPPTTETWTLITVVGAPGLFEPIQYRALVSGNPVLDSLAVGMLVCIGEVGKVTTDCMVKEIRHMNDLIARVQLMQYSPLVHSAAEELIPEFDPNITVPIAPELKTPAAPILKHVITDERALFRDQDGTVRASMQLVWDLPSVRSANVGSHDVPVDSIQVQYRPVRAVASDESFTRPAVYSVYVNNIVDIQRAWHDAGKFSPESRTCRITDVQQGDAYTVRIRSVSASGQTSAWRTRESIRIVGKTSPPPPVYNLRWEDKALVWDYQPPLDHAGFKIRAGIGPSMTWDIATAVNTVIIRDNRYLIPSEFGAAAYFFVKAVDTSGNESTDAESIGRDEGMWGIDSEVVRSAANLGAGSDGSQRWYENTDLLITPTRRAADVWGGTVGNRPFYREAGLPRYVGVAGDLFYKTTYEDGFVTFWDVVLISDNPATEIDVRRIFPEIVVSSTDAQYFVEWGVGDAFLGTSFWERHLFPANESEEWMPRQESMDLFFEEDPWMGEGVERMKPCVGKAVPSWLETPAGGQWACTFGIRLRWPAQNEQFILDSLWLVMDAPTRQVYIPEHEYDDAVTGSWQLPGMESLKSIETVGLTILPDGVYNAVTARVTEINNAVEPPTIKIELLDTSGAQTAGACSAIVKGYR